MFENAKKAYEQGAKSTNSTRGLEAGALFKAARLLEGCRQDWDANGRDEQLTEALRYNQKLWTHFQAELADPNHPMPAETRANLLRLSAFVDRRTFELMANPDPEKLRALIDINRNIATGLSSTPHAG